MNIIIVDFIDLSLYKLISNIPNIIITAICVPFDEQKDKILSYNPTLRVYTWNDVITWNKSYVSAEDIRNNQQIQLKIERYYARFAHQSGPIESYYYHALAFWISILKENVECVLIADQEHGIPVDSLPLALAKEYKIPAFTFEPIFGVSENVGLYAIHNYNLGEYVDVASLNVTVPPIDTRNILFNNASKCTKNKCFSHEAMHILTSAIRKKIMKNDVNKFGYFGIPREINIIKCIHNWIHIYSMRAYIQRLSENNLPKNGKYILYALHFEPEATIMNRTTYNSQIHNIEMLAHALPNGWTVYVKEHPDQLNIKFLIKNKFIGDNLDNYRNKLYYDMIARIDNVKFLDYRISSKQIMKEYRKIPKEREYGGLQAIATINGTISIEAMDYNIPIIMFDSNSMPYKDIDSIYVINSETDIFTTMDKLNNNPKNPNYDNFEETIGRYLFVYDKKRGINISESALDKMLFSAKAADMENDKLHME